MTEIILKDNVKNPEHIMVLTNNFVDQFDLPEKVTNYFNKRFAEEKAKGNKGNSVLTYNYVGTYICIVTLQPTKDENQLHEQLRGYGNTVAETVNQLNGKTVSIFNQTRQAALSLFAAEGIALANYQFIAHKSEANKKNNSLQQIIINGKGLKAQDIKELNIICDATARARDLVNEPVNVLNASDLANAFKKFGKEAGFKVEVFGKQEIKKMKMGGLLAVNAGSVDEPTFSVMRYEPAGAKNKKPIVLVGKGVVYDTGGLSIKPTTNSMDLMKCDMAGAAAVGAAMFAIAKAGVKVRVIGIVPATDNRPGFNAFAPGDIIKMMDGSTVEMLNSDAEGRMILADALHYAKQFSPEIAIDIATLTGSAVAAIGTGAIVGMGNVKGKYRDQLVKSSFRVHERIAEFPFWDDYSEQMKSDVADQKNIGSSNAGAITAGKFLEKFTDYPYYHLDIAGPAFLTAKDSYRGKGGTGVGVRLFFDFIKNSVK